MAGVTRRRTGCAMERRGKRLSGSAAAGQANREATPAQADKTRARALQPMLAAELERAHAMGQGWSARCERRALRISFGMAVDAGSVWPAMNHVFPGRCDRG